MKTIMIALVGLVGLSAMGGDALMRTFPDGARVAFFGDSITRNGGAMLRVAAHYRTAFPEGMKPEVAEDLTGGRGWAMAVRLPVPESGRVKIRLEVCGIICAAGRHEARPKTKEGHQ